MERRLTFWIFSLCHWFTLTMTDCHWCNPIDWPSMGNRVKVSCYSCYFRCLVWWKWTIESLLQVELLLRLHQPPLILYHQDGILFGFHLRNRTGQSQLLILLQGKFIVSVLLRACFSLSSPHLPPLLHLLSLFSSRSELVVTEIDVQGNTPNQHSVRQFWWQTSIRTQSIQIQIATWLNLNSRLSSTTSSKTSFANCPITVIWQRCMSVTMWGNIWLETSMPDMSSRMKLRTLSIVWTIDGTLVSIDDEKFRIRLGFRSISRKGDDFDRKRRSISKCSQRWDCLPRHLKAIFSFLPSSLRKSNCRSENYSWKESISIQPSHSILSPISLQDDHYSQNFLQ